MSTRARILHAAMELFGTQGYAATTIAQIESAAGLSPGSGGLYKHFRSKEALLEAGVRERVEAPDPFAELFAVAASAANRRDALRVIADAGMRRLESDRDLNRILVRDLAKFPRLLALFRETELTRVHRGLTAALDAMGISPADAVSVVMIAAVSDYWLLADIFGGEHPLGVGREAFLDTVTDLATAAIPAEERT
jgi:AcrR family transcriptional regulator